MLVHEVAEVVVIHNGVRAARAPRGPATGDAQLGRAAVARVAAA